MAHQKNKKPLWKVLVLVMAHIAVATLWFIGIGLGAYVLSITHKFCPDIEAELDVNKTRQSAPHDSIAWWSIMSTVEVSAQPCNLVQIVG